MPKGSAAHGDGATRHVDLRHATAVQVGDNPQLHLHQQAGKPAWWTRSGYIEQVYDIAPAGGLRDRGGELAELAAFCAGDEPYLWWRAGPWAGKSALMSTFLLNPPPGVDVVSFFVTARLAAQSDSAAFTDALLDQLSALLGEGPPALLSPTQRDAHRRAMLRAAAQRVDAAGRRLVLVVDGLDEDRGGRAGSGLPSIASLLPKDPHPGIRVVIASRPHPWLPDDVGRDHPLRSCRVRELSVSPHATSIAERATRELAELLHASHGVPHDILGLITACGGGLMLDDLAHLTGLPHYRLTGVLDGVFGRTVRIRRELYMFSHETLRDTAVQQLGSALDGYRQRLHRWADEYRQRGWPIETPQYLLRGYRRMLQDTHDATRLVALATDRARQDRLLDLTGGDAAGLTEIRTAQDLVLDDRDPDLLTMARISIRRADLARRNAHIPTDLPAVWAVLGQPVRAESLASGISDLRKRAEALAAVAESVAAAGDLNHAQHLVSAVEQLAPDATWTRVAVAKAIAAAGNPDRAEEIARDIGDSYHQPWALAAAAGAVAAGGDLDRALRLATAAERVARSITDPGFQGWALVPVVKALAAAGDPDRAEQVAGSIDTPGWQADGLAAVTEAVAAAGDSDRARNLAAATERIAGNVTDPGWHESALVPVVKAVAAAGDPDRAERIAGSITDLGVRTEALTAVARVLAAAGHLNRAQNLAIAVERVARTITDPEDQAYTLCAVARAVAAAGDPNRALELACAAERVARTITDRNDRLWALTAAAGTAAIGDPDRAKQMARNIPDPGQQIEALTAVAKAVATAGDPDRAERIARDFTDPADQTHTLTAVAGALAAAGDPDRAERIARTLTDPTGRTWVLVGVAKAVAAAGDLDRAEQIARSISDPDGQVMALTAVAEAMAAAGDLHRAQDLANTVERIAGDLAHPTSQGAVLPAVARAVAAAGDPDRAEYIARTLAHPPWQADVLAAVAEAVAAAGDPNRAEQIAHNIIDPDQQTRALTCIAEVVGLPGANRVLAEAFAVGSWIVPLRVLAKLRPELIGQLAHGGTRTW